MIEGEKFPTRHAGESPTGQTVLKISSPSSLQKALGQYKGDPESNSDETGKDTEQEEEGTITTGQIAGEEGSSRDGDDQMESSCKR